MTMDRQRKLQDALDHLNEVERLKNFKFEPWRKRFLQWMRHNKSRIMELFRRIDRDKDGRITRKEFIDGIVSTSKIIILTISHEKICYMIVVIQSSPPTNRQNISQEDY